MHMRLMMFTTLLILHSNAHSILKCNIVVIKNSAGVLNLLTLLYQNIRAVKRTRRIVHEEAVKHSALLPTAS